MRYSELLLPWARTQARPPPPDRLAQRQRQDVPIPAQPRSRAGAADWQVVQAAFRELRALNWDIIIDEAREAKLRHAESDPERPSWRLARARAVPEPALDAIFPQPIARYDRHDATVAMDVAQRRPGVSRAL